MNALIITENILQALVAGMLLGSIYGLMCVGLGLIYGVMRVINFAQGDFLMLGMYATLYVFGWLGLGQCLGPYLGPVMAALLGAVVLYGFGVVLHRTLLARVTGMRVAGTESEGHYPQLMLTLGMSLIIANGGLIAFGSMPQTLRTPLSASAWEIGPLLGHDLSVFLNKARSVGCIVSVLVAWGLHLFISRSRLGKTLRAAADNPEAATYMGINENPYIRLFQPYL